MAKKVILENTALTHAQFQDLVKCSRDIFHFSKGIWVTHPTRGRVKFDLYPYQKSVLWHFLIERFNIILKFRQAGLTELIAMFVLWRCLFFPNQNIIILSIKDTVAKKVLRRIKFMYKNLPPHQQLSIVNGRKGDYGTASEMVFSNGSCITSVPTTEQAARSEPVSLLVMDEAAIIKWADTIWASAFPTLAEGGRAIINSTPFGTQNFFHKMWVKAINRSINFNPIRLKWNMHPERDEDWYREQSSILGPRRTAQEIDGDFLSSGNTVFNLNDIRAIEERVAEIEWESVKMGGSLLTLEKPNPLEIYTLGADVSSGRALDYSTFTIYDSRGREVVVFKKKIEPGKFADLIMSKGKEYNMACLAPETNDVGLAVTSRIQEQGYPNLYYSKKILRKKGTPREEREVIPGWLTTRKNRPLIIDELEEDIRLNNIEINDPFFVQEAYTFIYDESNRPIAMGKNSKTREDEILADDGYTDDSIFGKAIANRVRKERPGKHIIKAV